MIAERLFRAASALEDAGVPQDVVGRLYESFAQAALIEAGVGVDLMGLCGFDNPAAVYTAPKPPAQRVVHYVGGTPEVV